MKCSILDAAPCYGSNFPSRHLPATSYSLSREPLIKSTLASILLTSRSLGRRSGVGWPPCCSWAAGS